MAGAKEHSAFEASSLILLSSRMVIGGGNAVSIPGTKTIAVARSIRAVAPDACFSKDGDEHSAPIRLAKVEGSIARISDGDELTSLMSLIITEGGSEVMR